MAKKKRPAATNHAATTCKVLCSLPQVPVRTLREDVTALRAGLILSLSTKWVNGTVLRYCFLNSPARWKGAPNDLKKVRDAFKLWKELGIGIDFKEVASPSEAELRIGFERGDGHWSYVGRDVLTIGPSDRTMNLDRSDDWTVDTALHEIGHSLGLPHEHQNPKAGIVWDEEAVYAALAAPPNRWSQATTFHNIISKIGPDAIQGSTWDPNSIMHYPFEAGLIVEPARYREGLEPEPGLSSRDREWILKFYPALKPKLPRLAPFESARLDIEPAEQSNFAIEPDATRTYTIATFGESDSVLVLFEDVGGDLRYMTADDDSGENYNATIQARLVAGRKYVVRLRLYYQFARGNVGLMLW